MLSPILLKNGCSPTVTTTYRSPAGPPRRPASPLAGTQILEPVTTPASNTTSTVVLAEIRPSPSQIRHKETKRPEPPQSAHVTANCRCPFARIALPPPP